MNQQTPQNILAGMLGGKVPFDASCPSRQLLSHITSRWGVLTLISLHSGPKRFSEIRHQLTGVSERMLIKVLKDFEADGLILRKSFPVTPPHTEYTLTPAGEESAELVIQLTDWIGHYLSDC